VEPGTDDDGDVSGSAASEDIATAQAVVDALRTVQDPCSVAMQSPMNLVRMGLVEAVEVIDGAVRIELLLTDPMCFFFKDILESVQDAVRPVPGVRTVDVRLSHTELWTRDRIGTVAPRLVQISSKPRRSTS
jgi:metal-sulfur cluster biosynthetic enzyme